VGADADEDAWCRTQLKWAIQSLAIPADAQLRLFPDFACKPDELALIFDQFFHRGRPAGGLVLTDRQRAALVDIEQQFTAMSAEGDESSTELWTDDGLKTSEHWARIRSLAAAALAEFGWPLESPPEDPKDRDSHYVR
jgi:hypothetical protein